MIISHENKYVFVQMPRTASSSFGEELCKNYAGEPVLHKHAGYDEFLEQASPEEKNYFSFTGKRNPLDCLVTEYFRRKAGERLGDNRLHLEKYNFIKNNEASFAEFVKKFHYHFHRSDSPFYRNMDFVYRFENLQEDFSKVLDRLGLKQIRPLPQFNSTPGKTDSYLSYYSRDIQPMIRIVLGRRMKKAGYDFPEGWEAPLLKVPFLYTLALAKSVIFALKCKRLLRGKFDSNKADDSYSRKLRKTYVDNRKSQ